jgi:flagellar protein FlbT
MPLRLSLRAHERAIIGGAVIHNGETRCEFLIENEVPVLRESDVLSPGSVQTACERVYLALQLMYVDPARAETHAETFRVLVEEVRTAAPSCGTLLDKIVTLADTGRLYQALKSAQALREREKEIIQDVC